MTYKQAVDLFRLQYEVVSDRALNDEKILAYISVAQLELQHKYSVIEKNSQNNDTAQTTCIVGTATHSVGTGATNLPNDVYSINEIRLDDDILTELEPTGRSFFNVKPGGKPRRYAWYGQGSNQILELDAKPDSAYVMTIKYIQRMEIFTGSNTDTTWSDWDKTASGWGGSLKLVGWENLIIQGALAISIDPMNAKGLKTIWERDADDFYASVPLENSGGDIQAYDGVSNEPTTIIPGQDEPRN